MAIRPCKECGNQISDKADSCPQCGVKIKKTSLFIKIILGFIIFTILIGVIGTLTESEQNSNTPLRLNSSNEVPAAKKEIIAENWYYQTNNDELNDQDVKFAVTESLNKVMFNFPYDGGSNLMLTVRKNHAGIDVYISITKGQFVCGVVNGCDVAFKFDNGEVIQITMVEPESYASDVLFVKLDSTENKIINKLKTSKKLIIAPNFYQHGVEQFKFDVSNYKTI